MRQSEPRRGAWVMPAEGRDSFQPHWSGPAKQGQLNTQAQYNQAQRQWAGHFPLPQQTTAFPIQGPGPTPPCLPGGRPKQKDDSQTGNY